MSNTIKEEILNDLFVDVSFIKITAENSFTYLEQKWDKVLNNFTEAYDKAINSLMMNESNTKSPSFIEENNMPAFKIKDLKIFSKIANNSMPLLENETLEEEDKLYALKEDDLYPQGTLVLRRISNFSEVLYFYSDLQVIDGVLYHFDNSERKEMFNTLQLSEAWQDPSTIEEAELNPQVALISMSAVAATVLMSIIGGAASKIGSKAMEVALKALGIDDLMGHAELTYDQLVKALEGQSRKDFRRQIRIHLSSYERATQDYNNGAKTEEELRMLYQRALSLVSWIQESNREPDRVELLAFAQCAYLSIMQERAEWYRDKDPEKLKAFYQAFKQAAAREQEILSRVRDEAIAYRLNKITPVSQKWSVGWLYYYEDVVPVSKNWHRYNLECTWYVGHGCQKWSHDSPSGRYANDLITKRRNQYVQKVTDKLRMDTFKKITEILGGFAQIANIQIPPPPPTKD